MLPLDYSSFKHNTNSFLTHVILNFLPLLLIFSKSDDLLIIIELNVSMQVSSPLQIGVTSKDSSTCAELRNILIFIRLVARGKREKESLTMWITFITVKRKVFLLVGRVLVAARAQAQLFVFAINCNLLLQYL